MRVCLAGGGEAAGQDEPVHEEDVGHDHERGQAGARLRREISPPLAEFEIRRDGVHGSGTLRYLTAAARSAAYRSAARPARIVAPLSSPDRRFPPDTGVWGRRLVAWRARSVLPDAAGHQLIAGSVIWRVMDRSAAGRARPGDTWRRRRVRSR